MTQMNGVSMMGKFEHGEIWLVRYKFEESNEYKARPVVILGDKAYEFRAYKMTSQKPRDKYDYKIRDYYKSGLSKPTTIRISKYIKITEGILIKKLGRLNDIEIRKVIILINEYYNEKRR